MTDTQIIEALAPVLGKYGVGYWSHIAAARGLSFLRTHDEGPVWCLTFIEIVRKNWPLADCRPLWDGTRIDGYVVLLRNLDGRPDGRYPPCLGKTETEAWAVAAIVADRAQTGEPIPAWITWVGEEDE